ncbi:AbrB/MazE/SpoVT family DNA-binding domain-containing protein [Candidatus Woesearchaeota archaeon]|nr:AbrB/MazE/SpoVT family DNA-binding domain-containing protein [Candidatus Woesearchaeota archaeon]
MSNGMIIKVSKGQQITIPSDYRKEFGWQVGSNVELTKEGNKIVIKPIGDDLQKLFGEARNLRPKLKLTAKQMDEVVEREILGH